MTNKVNDATEHSLGDANDLKTSNKKLKIK
jgi:hypothetical protein